MAYDWNFFINLYTRYYKIYDLSQLNLPLSEVIEMGFIRAIIRLKLILKRHKLRQFKKRKAVLYIIFIKSKPTML